MHYVRRAALPPRPRGARWLPGTALALGLLLSGCGVQGLLGKAAPSDTVTPPPGGMDAAAVASVAPVAASPTVDYAAPVAAPTVGSVPPLTVPPLPTVPLLPTAVPVPAAAPPSPTPVAANAPSDQSVTDNSVPYQANVAVAPPEAVAAPEERVVQTWKVVNTGNTAWTGQDRLVLQPGSKVAAPRQMPLPAVPPGGSAEITVPITLPAAPGTVSAIWRLTTADGRQFGDPLRFTARVNAAANTFSPYWVVTTRRAELKSGAHDPAETFGVVPAQFRLEVLEPRQGSRYLIRNPATEGIAYVDVSAVHPSGAVSTTKQTSTTTSTSSKAAASSGAGESGATYVVQAGDTLYSIARHWHVSLAALTQANGLTDQSKLKIGQVLRIPTA